MNKLQLVLNDGLLPFDLFKQIKKMFSFEIKLHKKKPKPKEFRESYKRKGRTNNCQRIYEKLDGEKFSTVMEYKNY